MDGRTRTRAWLAAACLVAFGSLLQAETWRPSPGHAQFPIWPEQAPKAHSVDGPEDMMVRRDPLVAGRPWLAVRNVSRPTMTVYPAKGKNTGAAVVVFPGGGYQVLAIDLEGTEVCDWLTAKGITCALLKYRVPRSGPSWYRGRRINPKPSAALQDAQRAVGLLRFRRAEWGVAPSKIGVLGFSAGGHLAAAVSTDFARRAYPAVDAADKESARPDFAAAIYPGHLWEQESPSGLNPDIEVNVSSRTPPTFLLQAQDDRVDPVEHSLAYYAALKKAKVPVELHFYAEGGHAFGLRRTKFPITNWPGLVETWLGTIGMIPD